MKDDLKESIKIPEGLDKAILGGFNKGKNEKQKIKKISFLKKTAMVAGIAVCTTLTATTINPNIVKAIPGMKKIIQLFKNDGNGESLEKYIEFSTSLQMSKTDNGITVSLEDVVVDDNKFLLTLIIEGDKLIGDNIAIEVRPKINEEPIIDVRSTVKKLGDNKVAVITTGNTSNIQLNDEANLQILIGGVLLYTPTFKEINGDWKMNVKVKKQEALKHSFVNNNEETMLLDDIRIKTGDLIVSKLGVTIKLKGNVGTEKNKEDFSKIKYMIKNDKKQDLIIDIIDGKINPSTGDFYATLEILSDISDSKYLEIMPIIFNDYNQFKDGENGYTLCELVPSENTKLYSEIITIDKIHYIIDKEKTFVSLDELIGTTIEINNITKVTIKNIENINDETKITVQHEGILDSYDIHNLTFIDSELNAYRQEKHENITVFYGKDETTIAIPKLDNNKKYKIGFFKRPDYKIYEKNKVRLDLE
ncbi:DUF4179 domain-containing protein [Clostridium tarantellae]|uniref:DUF4179 domain-containing protein n=1 Tax=Clostridium tarantellae TaxID=39493 RepID=A0A6I1MKL6_9CLOT|nr:DUF4179 domain-containing protein [Clostridium tarantellae]MPQ42677.1 DUF4179 domain-containing protein [Clostridium tarantellae]